MDIQLAYTETGAGEPLFPLHGNGEDRSYFGAQIPAFSAAYRVIAVDTRGHGLSPRGSAPFTLSQFADDLAALMDSLGIGRANILGFSDGGNIALVFALRYPGRVNRLIVDGANLYPTGVKFPVLLFIDTQFMLQSFLSAFSESARRKREFLGLMACQPHIRPRALGRLSCPTLVIAGTRDVIRERHTKRIARSIPGSRLALLTGSHSVAMESPQAFNRTVLDFLREREPNRK